MQETVESPQRCRSPRHGRSRQRSPCFTKQGKILSSRSFERPEFLRRRLKVASIGGKRILRRSGFGRHHVEKSIDQRPIARLHVRASASAAIIRAIYSWPVWRSALSEWNR